ncbi:hypothetical protein Shal_3515 [Shewanella halifaxensis HAW-EB4]|uniref:Uncharacterized protein n=1 Tax=Shewanella halifaxensis (strain HAW-EB4) TaxID=458817 RepID=B0TTB7_SHEHH|nr:hypothetical protein [Shewanella halifaxensis]ABZ78058.1 hypothetical protein Shal_3515 [Shewanella halifaxensis HAW-EB4]
MALCLNLFSLPNGHIQFLKHNPQTIQAYLMGQAPELEAEVAIKQQSLLSKLVRGISGRKALELPRDWPQDEIKMIGPNVNHRNVDLYHYILNDTEERVKGAGSLFQTWLDIHNHDAIKMDRCNESFAFESYALAELFTLLSKLDEPVVRGRFDAWLLEYNPDYIPKESEYLEMIQGWEHFRVKVHEAMEVNHGLMWVTL